MELLVENVEGRRVGIEDYAACEEAVKKFHESGFVHGDLYRHNFLVDDGTEDSEGERVTLIYFENAGTYDRKAARKELNELSDQLREETGRGAPSMLRAEGNQI